MRASRQHITPRTISLQMNIPQTFRTSETVLYLAVFYQRSSRRSISTDFQRDGGIGGAKMVPACESARATSGSLSRGTATEISCDRLLNKYMPISYYHGGSHHHSRQIKSSPGQSTLSITSQPTQRSTTYSKACPYI